MRARAVPSLLTLTVERLAVLPSCSHMSNHFLQIQDSLLSKYVKRYRVRMGRGTSYVCIDRNSNMFGGLIGQAGKVYVPAMARAVLCSAQPCCLYLS